MGVSRDGSNLTSDSLVTKLWLELEILTLLPGKWLLHSEAMHGLICFCVSMVCLSGMAAETSVPKSLFNGRDLTGWINVNCAPETWSVQDGVIHCTGHPTGALRTPRQYENFVLELDWRHLSVGGNSGIFIWATPIAAPGVPFLRAVEVQVLDNGYQEKGLNEWFTTHGDVFPIHGATMTPFGRHKGQRSFPSEERSKSSPEWNHYRITATNGVIRLEVNGKEVSGGEHCHYRKGYLGLESEGGPVEFKNIVVTELPSSGATDADAAPVEEDWKSLFSGIDLRGWRRQPVEGTKWNVESEKLVVLQPNPSEDQVLWSDARFGNGDLCIDFKPMEDVVSSELVFRSASGSLARVPFTTPSKGSFQRFIVSRRGLEIRVTSDGTTLNTRVLPSDFVASKGEALEWGIRGVVGTAHFMNVYWRPAP